MDADTRSDLIKRINALSRPLRPQASGATAQLAPLSGIRTVLFDIYGTLIISAAGDIGLGGDRDGKQAFASALQALGRQQLPLAGDFSAATLLKQTIKDFHAERQAEGIDYPEVDIVRIWNKVLRQIPALKSQVLSESDLQRVALEYECRVNPVWPMPGLRELLTELRGRDMLLGVVSNAQFYTPLMFRAFLGSSLDELGFTRDFCAWSYRQLEAKPSTRLYLKALGALERLRGVRPQEVLYVGNDMLKDIWPASQLGCRTALFAGDARSLRLRKDDGRCMGVVPDLVVTQLSQISDMLA